MSEIIQPSPLDTAYLKQLDHVARRINFAMTRIRHAPGHVFTTSFLDADGELAVAQLNPHFVHGMLHVRNHLVAKLASHGFKESAIGIVANYERQR